MAKLPRIDSDGLRLAKSEGAKRVSSVTQVSLGYYGCKMPPGYCGCPQDARKNCRHSVWVEKDNWR